jgi:hypothetical protein
MFSTTLQQSRSFGNNFKFPESGEAQEGGASFQNEADDDEWVFARLPVITLTPLQPLRLTDAVARRPGFV